MGGGGFGRAYASGSNTQINKAALAKAAARAPKTVGSVISKQQEELVDLYSNPFSSTIDSPSIGLPEPIKVTGSRTEPTTPAFKAGDREDVYDDAGNKVGFTLYKEQKSYDGYGNVTGSKVVPRTTYYAPSTVQKTAERKKSYGDKSIADIAAQLEAEAPAKARTGMDLYSEFDPNRGAMQGYSVDSYNREINVEQPLLQAFQDLEVPAYKEFDVPELDTGGLDYDKTKLYTNYGKRGQLEFPNEAARQEYYEKERTGTFHDVSELLGIDSELGQQTMVWVKNPPEPSKWEKFLGNPVLQVVGLLNPTVALATTGAKLASGVDVSPVELASSALTGLNMAGVTKPPALGDIPVGGGPPQMTKGTGLFGTTYGQTQTALNVAAAGDAKGAAIALVGNDIIKGGLDKVGLDQATIERAGIQYDDFEAGLGKTVQKLAAGEELDEALAFGLGTYIREGGTLGSIDLPETNIDLGVIEDVVRDIVRPIGKVGTALADFVEEAMPDIDVDIDIDTRALRPLEDVIKAGGRATEDAVRAAGSVIDDTVIQPIREAGKEFDDVVTQPVGDALSALDTAIRQALPDIDLPDVDLPSIDLPSIDLPFDLLPSLMSDTGQDFIPSPTRTTDSLFNDELFKFETEIGISDYPLVDEELELFYPESAPQLDYAPDYDNFFENTIYEAKPRSYDF
jgi:hypothetical protein